MSRPAGSSAGDQMHRTRVVVWDVPTAVAPGERFTVKLGVKCSFECRLGDRTVEVRGQDGATCATATLGDEPWPGTDALYHAETELSAPDTEGFHTWEATALVDGQDPPHAGSTEPFRVRILPTPECVLRVVATDIESQQPVEGARVVVHPYETFTDESGVAEVRVPKGGYRLFVSGKKYAPFRSEGEMDEDVTIRVELAPDPEPSDSDADTDADVWY